jgi:hypothetical protein
MEITKQKSIEKFIASAGVNFQFGEEIIETLAIQFEDIQVKLNKEQCRELLNVLKGKCSKVVAFENKDQYSPHSAIFFSPMNDEKSELILYTENSLAKF